MPLDSAAPFVSSLELPQLQLPSRDLPWNPDLPAYVTIDHVWGRAYAPSRSETVGPAPPLPSTAEDLGRWSWCYPLAGEQPVEVEEQGRRVRFYRHVSNGSAAARISRPLNNCRCYWELRLGDRMFGTSIMVGVGGARVRNHTATFKNLIGEDEHGWGLSHKGVVWHEGLWSPYTEPFPQNEATTIGVLFDGVAGTLGFFKDNRWLGVAFNGLDKVSEPLYPWVASTARNTTMTLLSARRDLGSLSEWCRVAVLREIHRAHRERRAATKPRSNQFRSLVRRLPLPEPLLTFLQEGVSNPVSLPATNPAHRLLI